MTLLGTALVAAALLAAVTVLICRGQSRIVLSFLAGAATVLVAGGLWSAASYQPDRVHTAEGTVNFARPDDGVLCLTMPTNPLFGGEQAPCLVLTVNVVEEVVELEKDDRVEVDWVDASRGGATLLRVQPVE